MNELVGRIVLPNSIMGGRILFDEYIISIEPKDSVPDLMILPGILDLHIHGGGGGDVMDGERGIRQLARTHAKFGLTGFLATTMTAEDNDIDNVIASARDIMLSPDESSAHCLGVHLEGPYLSATKMGAQLSKMRPVNEESLERWFSSGVVRVMSYAPEQDLANVVPKLAKAYGVKIQIGHSGCAYQRAQNLLAGGCGITHLFNAMSGVHHRSDGVALAALNHAEYAEIICDGIHVNEPAFLLARQSIKSLYSVSDGTAASGMPDGIYRLGGHDIIKSNDSVRLRDGTLAGSASTAEKTVQTLNIFGLDWPEIAALTASRPAKWLDREDLGHLIPGKAAHFSVFKGSICHQTWVAGKLVQT